MLVVVFLISAFAAVALAVTDQSGLPVGLLPIILPLVGGSWLLWGVARNRRSSRAHLQRHHHGDSNRRSRHVALTSLAVPILITGTSFLAQGAFLVRYATITHDADTEVCKALQRLNGATAEPSVIAAIHNAGRKDDDRLGHIVRAADGHSWPGHLSLVSEDYDRVTNTCDGLSLPVPNMD